MKVSILFSLLMLAVATHAAAQVRIDDPWVRATVAQQRATGAFMNLTALIDSRLVAVQSAAANVVEIHEMTMDGDVMKMRAVEAVELPAGQTVEFKPGGYHVMLIGLDTAMSEGQSVPLTLVVESNDGERETVSIDAPVRPLTYRAMQHKPGHALRH